MGGEADKLGNFYEGIWTVDSVLDLLSGDALSLQVEPFDLSEALGIEFIKNLANGTVEYHSVKRQKIGLAWSLADLTKRKSDGRSILGDLFSKLALNPSAQCVFVSQTGANELLELCDRARRCTTPSDLQTQLKESKALEEKFRARVLPLCGGDVSVALDRLKRSRAVAFEEQELLRRVAQKTTQWIYRRDGGQLDPDSVRHLLAELAINRLGQVLRKSDILRELESQGFYLRVWAEDPTVMSRITEGNERYLTSIRRQFINGQAILRDESSIIAKKLTEADGPKGQLTVGGAGMGKSCVTAEIVELLTKSGIPVLCLRLDNLPHILTSENLGKELGFPASPAIVLAGVANGQRCVLVIDQLDALSTVSGRNDFLWPVFHQLVAEAQRVPQMRLLLACRSFDFQHDQRIRELSGEGGIAAKIEISSLSVEQVHSAVRVAGGNPDQLNQQQLVLLRVPFNLQLFLQGDPKNYASFRSVKDLFDRYWDCKAASVFPKLKSPNAWNDCISAVANSLANGDTSAPADILDEYYTDARTMGSEGVFVLENNRWRFFHESFGDYAFARQFVRKGRDLIKFLTEEGGEQHLYRRTQVRQILTYERDRDRNIYVSTLRKLLSDPKVRLHIKKLTLGWLSQLDDPGKDEWQILEPLLDDAVLGPHVFAALWEKLSWFDLLQRLGVWQKLLTNYGWSNGCIRMLSLGQMMEKRSDVIAGLLVPHRKDMPNWQDRFRAVCQFGQVHHSREIFNLTLDLVDDGFFDDMNSRDSLIVHNLCEHRPGYAVEFIARYLDRLCAVAQKVGETNPFFDPEKKRGIRDHEIRAAAEKVPLLFMQEIAPRLEKIVVANANPPASGWIGDKIWRYLTFGAEHDMDDALLFSAARALNTVAASDPEAVAKFTRHWEEFRHRALRFLLFRAWAGNGAFFGNRAAAYFVEHPETLEFGYSGSVNTEGSITAAISRELLQAISPHCDGPSHLRLEAAICSIGYDTGEDAKRNRAVEYMLLKSLQENRLGEDSLARLKDLEKEFTTLSVDQPSVRKSFFGRPAGSNADYTKLSDQQWIELLETRREGDEGKLHQIVPDGVADVLGPLNSQARHDPRRFAALVLQMGDDVPAIYFGSILEAVTPEQNGVLPLDAETYFKVITRLHQLPDHPCGMTICRTIYRISEQKLPIEIVDVVGYYALHDPDPGPNDETGSGKDLVNHAINTVRGNAVDGLARLLFGHRDFAGRMRPFIEAVSRDASPSVRAVTIHVLLALLNIDRDMAVRLFLSICEEPRIWGSHHVDEFLYYATFTHYSQLQPLLREMLASADEEARRDASRQICLAAFNHPEAEADLSAVLNGDEICRQAAAQIYAENHLHPSIRAVCEKHLTVLFNDPENNVRTAAGHWVDHLDAATATGDWNFLHQFVESKAFEQEPGNFLHHLNDLAEVPTDVILRVADRAVELTKKDMADPSAKAFRFSGYTPPLVVRLYHQTDDESVQIRCLDLLDAMLSFGWNEVAMEMAKAEH